MFLKHYYKFSNTKQMNKVFRFFIPAFSALLTIIATACNNDSSTDDFGDKNGATTEEEKTEENGDSTEEQPSSRKSGANLRRYCRGSPDCCFALLK